MGVVGGGERVAIFLSWIKIKDENKINNEGQQLRQDPKSKSYMIRVGWKDVRISSKIRPGPYHKKDFEYK